MDDLDFLLKKYTADGAKLLDDRGSSWCGGMAGGPLIRRDHTN
jgi:hypothetical protein